MNDYGKTTLTCNVKCQTDLDKIFSSHFIRIASKQEVQISEVPSNIGPIKNKHKLNTDGIRSQN